MITYLSSGKIIMNKVLRKLWQIDEEITFLNHGSFGATPVKILEKQTELRNLIEKEPVKFFVRDYEEYYEKARISLSNIIGAPSGNIVFVPNATTGVNTALRSIPIKKNEEIIVTTQEYNACRNALTFIADEKGVKVKEVFLPFPLKSSSEVVEKLVEAVTDKTRYLLIDHIVSQTALLLDIRTIVKEMKKRGVETIVDGAHSIGQVPININDITPAYFTSNCHKWLCAPKGSAFLYVRDDFQKFTKPLIISHGANSQRTDKSRFFLEFLWVGTDDPTQFFIIPYVIDFLNSLFKNGLNEIMERNRTLCLKARDLICETLEIEKPCPDNMVGSMASFPLRNAEYEPKPPLFIDSLQDALFYEYKIEIPIIYFPKFPKRLLRISTQIYNDFEDYIKLSNALKHLKKRFRI